MKLNDKLILLENGGKVIQETRLYDADKNETRPMRSKEEANDYRYFPDPDLLPVILSKEYIEHIAKNLPELPNQKKQRFEKDYDLTSYDANILVSSKEMAEYFEATVSQTKASAKIAANWIIGDLSAALNKANLDISQCPIPAKELATLLNRINDDTISGKFAKVVFESLWEKEGSTDEIINNKGLTQITDTSEIEKMIDQVLARNSEQVMQYRAGKDKVFGFLVGQVMKETKGKANPGQVNELLRKKLAG